MQRSMHAGSADELLRMPDDGFRYELVNGRLIRMTPPGSVHGALAMRLGAALADYIDQHHLGVVFAAETGFQLTSDPDTVRAPDAAFVRLERIPRGGIPNKYWSGPPDLAIEVLSPDDSLRELDEKVRQYLDHGAQLVWVVDVASREVTVHRQGAQPQTLTTGDVLDGGETVPGFAYPVERLFRIIDR